MPEDPDHTAAEEYLAGLDDEQFSKLLARVRPPGSSTGPGGLELGRELYRRNNGASPRAEV
ncbi:hypothetical protein ASG82_23820 [Mycobacterium sp. Soil538]|nr:hypothetical protein ASG82_23820 [Mycobacterium sp. Soil538]